MKRLLISLSAVLALSAPAAAEVYVITDDENGNPLTETIQDPAMTEVPEIAGTPNKGFTHAMRWTGMDGFRVSEGRIAPGGTIATHDGPDTYILYVVSGKGALVMVADDGAETSRVNYKPNDVIVFGPGTLHHWVNSDEEFVFIGVEKP